MKNKITIIAALLFVFTFVFLINPKSTVDTQAETTLKESIIKASIQCYAIEGRYPDDVEYLEKNYGIVINHSIYKVEYDRLSSNILPTVMILEINK